MIVTDKKSYFNQETIKIAIINELGKNVWFYVDDNRITPFYAFTYKNGDVDQIATSLASPVIGLVGFHAEVESNEKVDFSFSIPSWFEKGKYTLIFQYVTGNDTLLVESNKFRVR
jgi:hypothetical protein